MSIALQPPHHPRGLRNRCKTAGVAKAGDGKGPVLLLEASQFPPDVLLADEQIGVFGVVADLPRRHAHADGIAGAHEIEDQLGLRFAERIDAVIAASQPHDGADRIRRTDQRIGGSDRHFHHAIALDHIAEVEQSADAAVGADEDVIVIGIIMDDLPGASLKARQHRGDEVLEDRANRSPLLHTLDQIDIGEVHLRPGYIPGVLSPGPGMRETGEAAVELAEQRPKGLDAVARAVGGSCPGFPGQPRQKTCDALSIEFDAGERGAGAARQGLRDRQFRRLAREMVENRDLHVELLGRAEGMQLQQERATIARLNAEIEIVLAGQRQDFSRDAVFGGKQGLDSCYSLHVHDLARRHRSTRFTTIPFCRRRPGSCRSRRARSCLRSPSGLRHSPQPAHSPGGRPYRF